MKQQYESEILFHLMERDGFNIPSSVPPYEAEIKAYLINQVKQAYPKLTDYEAEWLLYNYTKHLPADFPISSVTDVTEATFENVVPFAYKSAILKGQTLVNVVKEISFPTNANHYFYLKLKQYEINKDYLFMIFNAPQEITEIYIGNNTSTIVWESYTSYFVRNGSTISLKVTCPSNYDGSTILPHVKFGGASLSLDVLKQIKVMLIPYQQGMENWDIHYFEGMQSVKMPVLKTVGKNLFDMKNSNFITEKDGNYYPSSDSNLFDTYKLLPNTTYIISGIFDGWGKCFINGVDMGNFNSSGKRVIKKFTTNSTGVTTIYFGANSPSNALQPCYDFQLEIGGVFTAYEPHKTNILTCNEDIELCGIGEGQDELNLITGEHVQRIGDYIITGNETWSTSTEDGCQRFAFHSPNIKNIIKNNGYDSTKYYITCDKLPTTYWNNSWKTVNTITTNNASVYIQLPFGTTMEQAKALMIGTKIQYKLETPVIKTVDLKTVNESGESIYFIPLEGTMHIHSNGTPLNPTITMEIPVEATTQNLASFIDLEVEE